ncbi:MAG: hypothetical protein ACR2OC_07300 [Solirubrobacterales bacterium]
MISARRDRRNRRGLPIRLAALVALVAAISGAVALAQSSTPSPELISAAADGSAGNGPSLFPWASEDGRLVVFRSEATNIVADDTDTERDIYIRDRQTGNVALVSRASGAAGVKGNRASFNPRITPDGRFVVFRTNSSNLVPEDTDQLEDIYVRDLQANLTFLVSRASTAIGAKANGGSFNPSISDDGRFVAFRSEATNLAVEDTDPVPDIFVRDLQTNVTSLVSRASGAGVKGSAASEFPVISGNGTRIAFRSESPNLAPEDTDTIEDIFLRDLNSGETVLISRAAGAGAKGNARSTFFVISADGNIVAFDSQSTNLHPDDPDDGAADADVFVRDISTGALDLISRASGSAGAKASSGSSEPAVSADGRYVAFQSAATNLDFDDPDSTLDVYVRDRKTFSTEALSPAIVSPYNRSFEAQIAPDGSLVAFQGDAGTAGSGASVPPSDVFAVEVPKLDKCLGKRPTMVASAGAVTKGTATDDVIVGGPGEELIKAGKGKDLVCSGEGNDTVNSGGSKDEVQSGGGDDEVDGAAGSDRIVGGGGADRLDGGSGSDDLSGGGDKDFLDGSSGKDVCDGGGGKDKLKRCESP